MVQLKNVVKMFDNTVAVNKVSLDVREGEFLTLLGPSGCGKTTTLRMVAGFEMPTKGTITIDGRDVIDCEPYKRNVNTVFQSYALFPHMNIFNNIAFGLTMKKRPRTEIKRKVAEILELVQLYGYEKRMPDQLSGGQRQRVAIARALVNNPKVLLLDEPLGALDMKLRKQMQVELKRLQKKLGITFIYVTHDQEEALTMSDRIAVMNAGVIDQIACPDEIYEKPRTRFVADFIGETNFFEGMIDSVDGNQAVLKLENVEVKASGENLQENTPVYLAIRPEKTRFTYTGEHTGVSLQGWFKERIYAGSIIKTIFTLPNNQEVMVNESAGNPTPLQEDKVAFLTWDPEQAVIINI